MSDQTLTLPVQVGPQASRRVIDLRDAVMKPPTVVEHSGSSSARAIIPSLVGSDAAAGLVAAGFAVACLSMVTQGPIAPLTVGLASGQVVLWLSALVIARAYETRFLYTGPSELHRVGIAAGLASFPLLLGSWLTLDPRHSWVVLTAAAVGLLQALSGRWLIRGRAQRRNQAGVVRSKVVAVGGDEDLERLTTRLARNSYHGWAVVDRLVTDNRVSQDQALTDVVLAVRSQDADLVLLTPSAAAHLGSITSVLRRLQSEGVEVALTPPMVEAVGPRVSVEAVCGLPVLRIRAPELSGPRRWLKALADRVGAAGALLVAAPLLLLLFVAVRLTSPGSALFRQERVGRAGVPFTMLKLRSMYVDSESRIGEVESRNRHGEGPLFKDAMDPRVTPVGRLLRKWSLDELPQLVNVLRGDMSLVGPRPALPREVRTYDEDTRRRLLVAPGLTGLWQIHGRSDLDWEESRRLDLRYVENWSLGFDLSILVRTLDAVLRRRGAY